MLLKETARGSVIKTLVTELHCGMVVSSVASLFACSLCGSLWVLQFPPAAKKHALMTLKLNASVDGYMVIICVGVAL